MFRNKLNFTKEAVALLLVILIFLFTYMPLLGKYFEQDEWYDFAHHIVTLNNLGVEGKILNIFTSYLPITQLFNFLNYYFFGINNIFPVYMVFLLIVLNSIVWYKNIYAASRSNLIAIGSLTFGYLSYISMQSVTWVIPAVASQMAFLFINLCVFFALKYSKSNRLLYLFLSILFSVLTIMTRFNGFFVFLLIPIVYYLFAKKTKNKIKLVFTYFSVMFGLGAIFYVLMYFQYGLGKGRYIFDITQILLGTIYIPLKSLSQIILQYSKVFFVAGDVLVVNRYKLISSDIYIQTVITDLIAIALSLVFIIIFIFIVRKYWSQYKKITIFASAFFFLSLMPYIVDKFSTGTGFLESRYYNPAVFGVGVLLFIFIAALLRHIDSIRAVHPKNLLKLSVFIILVIYFFSNYVLISKNLQKSVAATKKREEILNVLHERIEASSSNNIVIFIKDTNHPTGLNNNTNLYFQTGVLYPLLVHSFSTGNVDVEYLIRDFWNPYFHGFIKFNSGTVGSFYDLAELKNFISSNNYPLENVYAIEIDYSLLNNSRDNNLYDLRNSTYRDYTDQVRLELRQEE